MTTTNQPSDAAKELSHRIVCEFRPDGWMEKEIEIAHLIDRHLTPSEPVGCEFDYKPHTDKRLWYSASADEWVDFDHATPSATVNSDAGLVEDDLITLDVTEVTQAAREVRRIKQYDSILEPHWRDDDASCFGKGLVSGLAIILAVALVLWGLL